MTSTDDLTAFDRRTVRRLLRTALLVAAGLAVVAVVVGGRAVSRAVRQAVDERDAFGLFHVVRGNGVAPGRPLDASGFEQAVALLDSPNRKARGLAVQAAGESAAAPARRDRLAELARRQVAAADPDDRHTGLLLAVILNLPEWPGWAEACQTDPDPGVRALAAGHLAAAPPGGKR